LQFPADMEEPAEAFDQRGRWWGVWIEIVSAQVFDRDLARLEHMGQTNAERNMADQRDALSPSFIDQGVVNRKCQVVIYLDGAIALDLVAAHELARPLWVGHDDIRWP